MHGGISMWFSQAFQFIHTSTRNCLHSTKVELGHFQWNFGGMFGGLGTSSIVVPIEL